MNTSRTESDMEHKRLAGLLGAYLDGELSSERVQVLEAHLLACERCRQELALQRDVRTCLEQQTIDRAPTALRERIQARLDDDTPAQPASERKRRRWTRVPAWTGWALAACLALVIGLHFALGRHASAQTIPMVTAALNNYHQQLTGTLPVGSAASLARLERSLPFPVTPIAGLRPHLVAAWSLRIRGTPAAALAYRLDGQLIVQYVVSESMFFRQPQVREAVAAHGAYIVSAGQESVMAWPRHDSGCLLIGTVSVQRLESLYAKDDVT